MYMKKKTLRPLKALVITNGLFFSLGGCYTHIPIDIAHPVLQGLTHIAVNVIVDKIADTAIDTADNVINSGNNTQNNEYYE